jgi:hypothetical protein
MWKIADFIKLLIYLSLDTDQDQNIQNKIGIKAIEFLYYFSLLLF